MAIRYNFNHADQNPWAGGFARPGRFGFEVVPDDAGDIADDELQYGTVLRTALACIFMVIFFYSGSRIYEKMGNFSWPTFENTIEKTVEPTAQMPKIDEALMPPTEPEVNLYANPEPTPQRRLFNPDGTMKASFPLPPDTPPEDYYVPSQEKPPLADQGGRGTAANFDAEQEAYDPAEEKATSTARRSARVSKPAKVRSIGEYEVFDPERDEAKSDWEFFSDPRR